MFTGLQNAVFQGGVFNLHNARSPFESSEGFKILHGNIASGAFHDSGERFDPPKCHPNTRVAVLAEIMEWIKAIEASEDVLWLYGSAGAGKSAIVQTIAEMCAKMGLLVASFFFSRASQFRDNEKRLISSIAYQLAISIPPTRSYIGSAIEIDPAIFDRSLDTQVERLIIRPLERAYADVKAAHEQWPRLIIIDGLDECHGPLIQCSIIHVLSAALIRIPVPLILLVASRPEPHIRSTFILLNKSHASRHIVLDGSYKPDADIRQFLLCRFKEIKENHPFSGYIPESWPSKEVIHRLVRKSSGQFIYASTVMKYLDCPKHQPVKRLDVILGLRSVDGDMPYKELDALYRYIFSCVEDFTITLKVLGFLFFERHWNSPLLTLLLGLDEEDVHSHLSELHSILYIAPPNAGGLKIRPTHASLQDFLVDKLRSGKYYLDEEVFHTDLALQCLRHIRHSTLLSARSHHRRQALKGVDLSYLASSFIHHCTQVSTDSDDLKNELMQVCDLRPFSEIWPIIIDGLPSLFTWLYKADKVANELSTHIQSLWDQHLMSMLNKYAFHEKNVDIAALLFFPLVWNFRFSPSLISSIPDLFRWHWGRHPDPYRYLLTEFFEDKDRSGKYHVDGVVYAHAALEYFRNMVDPNDDEVFNPYPFIVLGFERPDRKLFMSSSEAMASNRNLLVPDYEEGLAAVTLLLSKAAPLTDLYLYLRDHPLQHPAKAKVHCEHGFASLRLAVKAYLDKCQHLVPKVLRRSASCPLPYPYLGLELESGKHWRTFSERWPLNKDALARPGSGSWDTHVTMKKRKLLVLRSQRTMVIQQWREQYI